ncbi:hypothetical protein AGMMS49521_0050 [Campylobacterota bacterium]|nr:hypothetical protein AGMMS49521_0050 [Campylobacterota bacterium]
MNRFCVIFVSLIVCLLADDLDDFASFDSIGSVQITDKNEKTTNLWRGELYGFLDVLSALRVGKNGENGYRANAELIAKLPLWSDSYIKSDTILSHREWSRDSSDEAEFKELFLFTKLGDQVDLRVGRQIIRWGKSDYFRVIDRLNPIDSRDIGLIDIGDLRLGRTIARVDLFVYRWDFQLIALPENRFSKTRALTKADEPNGVSSAIAALGSFQSFDVGFYGARIYNDNPMRSDRYSFFGGAIDKAVGNLLIKSEFVWLDLDSGNEQELLIGAEYAGFHDITMALEAVTKDDTKEAAGRISIDLMNSRLDINLMANAAENSSGDTSGFYRFWGNYEVADNLTFSAGFVGFFGKHIESEKRIFAKIRAGF